MRYCLHSNNNNGKNQGAMTIETLQWTTFHSTMARSTFNFNKTAITITSLKFFMRVCVRVLRLPNVERKKAVFDIEIPEMVEYCRWWRAKTKYYPISCVHQFSMHKMCSIAFCSRFLHCDSVALFFIDSFNFQLVLSVGNYSSCHRSMSFFPSQIHLYHSISLCPSVCRALSFVRSQLNESFDCWFSVQWLRERNKQKCLQNEIDRIIKVRVLSYWFGHFKLGIIVSGLHLSLFLPWLFFFPSLIRLVLECKISLPVRIQNVW